MEPSADPGVVDAAGPAVCVVLADDHPVVAQGLSALLASMPEMRELAVAEDGAEAIALCRQLRPDLLVLDVEMPSVDGITAIRTLTAEQPRLRILVFSMHHDDDVLFAALRAGAHGYIAKGTPTAEIAQAMRSVAAGHAVFGPAVASRVLDYFGGALQQPQSELLAGLTEREREVLALMADGLTTKEIALRLVVTPKTTRNYISTVVQKLHVRDRANAIALARDLGVGTPPES